LEKESRRNPELMCLINRLSPEFKTIADFRRYNSEAIVQVCREFVLFCRGQGLFGREPVAIDGSKSGVAISPKQAVRRRQLEAELEQLDRQIQTWLETVEASDSADNEDTTPTDGGTTHAALEALQAERATSVSC
jgi:transposase